MLFSLCRYYDVTYFIVVYYSASHTHRVLAISVRSNFTFASFICFRRSRLETWSKLYLLNPTRLEYDYLFFLSAFCNYSQCNCDCISAAAKLAIRSCLVLTSPLVYLLFDVFCGCRMHREWKRFDTTKHRTRHSSASAKATLLLWQAEMPTFSEVR